MDEKTQKVMPWIIGGVAVIGGFILYKRAGGGSASGGLQYSVTPAPDNTAAIQAGAQIQSAQLAAGMAGFQSLLTLKDNDSARKTQLQLDAQDNATALSIHQLDTDTQKYNIQKSASVARHQDTTKLAASAISTIALLAFFCYDATGVSQRSRQWYYHGQVA